ncbi:MAG: phosphonate metabolism transcriptional regulator PhnF [Pseudomonadota bacterium]
MSKSPKKRLLKKRNSPTRPTKKPAPKRRQQSNRQEGEGALSRGEGIAVWRQIAEDISARIRSGQHKAGSRLPTETQLAESYGVNRHTLRRALSELARRGLIQAAPRRGTFVTDARIEYPIQRLTRFSENITAAGRQPGGKILSTQNTTAPPEMAEWLAIAEKAEVIQVELLRFANDLPVCWSFAWLPADRFERIPKALDRLGSVTKALEFLGIRNYRRKTTRISARIATAKERAMLQLDRGASVLVVESLNVDADGEPIQAATSVFSANSVQLIVESDLTS